MYFDNNITDYQVLIDIELSIFNLLRYLTDLNDSKRIRDASRYTIKKISLKFLFLSDIFLFPFIRQQVTVLA